MHDSDIAIVDYRPAPQASGRFFLGIKPRIYWEDDSASRPVDREAEARDFAQCARRVHGREVDAIHILTLMTSDKAGDEPEDRVVEETVDRLLDLTGLPLPEGMPSDDDD